MGSPKDETPPRLEEARGREERLFKAVEEYLRQHAARLLRRERRFPTFTTSDLVQEACASVLASSRGYVVDVVSLRVFAARAMRQVLIARARHKAAGRRIPRDHLTDLASIPRDALFDLAKIDLQSEHCGENVLLLDQLLALIRRKVSERAEQVVELRAFAGMTNDEIAKALGVTTRTIERDVQDVRDFFARSIQVRP